MRDIVPRLTLPDLLRYAIAYMFWLVAALLALAAMFMVRAALNAFWPAMQWNRWVLRPVDRFGLVLMGLLWLVFVIFCEQHYRSSITEIRVRRMDNSLGSTSRIKGARGNGYMRTLRRLGLDILAQRLVRTLSIPLAVLGVAYLVYLLSWVVLAR
jgi:hypothetical protein